MASQQDHERSEKARLNEMYQPIVQMIATAFNDVASVASQVEKAPSPPDHETLLGVVYGRTWYLVGRCR
jgi:hypothetical protein